MYIDDEELRGLYKTSAAEHIQAIESALMQLEKQPQNPAVLKDLLRSAHTLKGDSRMLGVEDVETLVHQIEECLMPIEKGNASMTEELCDRLYTGLDTIKQLAHTAVTGESNSVNMFYVLATLMGDSNAIAMPSLPAPREMTDLSEDELNEIDLDDLASDNWITLSNDENLFDTPSDLWIHEGNEAPLPLSLVEQPLAWQNEDETPLPRISTQLQANFLELASELFPPDSTLPPLTAESDFGDFTIMAGTDVAANNPDPSEDLSFLDDPSLIFMPGSNEIVRDSILDERESANEDDYLFTSFDDYDSRSSRIGASFRFTTNCANCNRC
jgi:two-component system, chemotaxis family, sensor kinase CheA